MDDFVFPDRPADLCDPRCELPLRCADLVDVTGLEREELDEFVDRTFARKFVSVFFFSFVVGVVGMPWRDFRLRQTYSPEKRALVLRSTQSGNTWPLSTRDVEKSLSLLSCEASGTLWRPFFSRRSHAQRRSRPMKKQSTIKKTGALYDVCNSDALSLLEQETFDRVYSLVR